jgi:hypothetical protein
MATPMDLFDAADEVMTYGGIADVETASGFDDRPMQWGGALTLLTSRVVARDARRATRGHRRHKDVTLLGRPSSLPRSVAR